MSLETWRTDTLLAKLGTLTLLWGCNGSEFDLTPSCDKGTEDCGCIADQHCLEDLVCAQGICLPKQSGTGGTTRGDTTGTGDETSSSTTSGSTTSGSTTSASASESTTLDSDDGSTTGSDDGTSESTGDAAGGAYSDCHDDPDVCERELECVEIDPGGRLSGAMCTSTGCGQSSDCDSPPDGTAQPHCLAIPPPTDDTVCVLICTDDPECPEGMQCHTLGLGIQVCG